jgi:hypothetical protein
VTSRDSFRDLYATSSGTNGAGVEALSDLGSVRGRLDGAPPVCTDPNDQCPVPACDPNDPDCVVLLATLNGPAKAGDACGPGSRFVGSPLTATAANGTTERVADIKYIVADFHNVSIPVGYVYVSDAGQNYFQPNSVFAVGGGTIIQGSVSGVEPPYVKMGNMTATGLSNGLKAALDAAKLIGMVVNQAAYSVIQGGTVGKADCFSSPHTGSWT